MQFDFIKTHQQIAHASRAGWDGLIKEITDGANNGLVDVDWDVTYDQPGHDIILRANVKVKSPEDALLQVWLQDQHPGIWIPALRPWVASVVEFTADQKVTKALVGLMDSKWRKEDKGQTYTALLWGYLAHGTNVESFAFNKDFTYPG